MATWADTSKRVNNDLNSMLLGCSHNASETLLTTKHFIRHTSINTCLSWGVVFSIFNSFVIFIHEGVVVSFKSSHEIQSINALHSILWNAVFYILESTSLNELVFLLVNSCVLIIYLNLVEWSITKATSMDYKPTLGNATHILLLSILFVVITIKAIWKWEDWIRFTNYFKRS